MSHLSTYIQSLLNAFTSTAERRRNVQKYVNYLANLGVKQCTFVVLHQFLLQKNSIVPPLC